MQIKTPQWGGEVYMDTFAIIYPKYDKLKSKAKPNKRKLEYGKYSREDERA